AFGKGRVLLNGQEVTQWDGHLPRSLFFYVVDRGMTTRNDIFQVFWPDLPVREATNVFHVTKRKINEVLGVNLTSYWSGFYRISSDIDLSYDAMQFSRMVQDSAVQSDEEARRLLSRAISLYRGEFLTSLDLPWVEQRRSALLQTYGEALVAQARISQDSGESARALGLYLRSALTNPQREDLVEHIMRLYDELAMYEDALSVYERLELELDRTLNVAPAQRIQDLAASVRTKL
ncbi:MAG: bacterial transcriptional activator domain-containing protein, partial [Chloroflexota bacterium]